MQRAPYVSVITDSEYTRHSGGVAIGAGVTGEAARASRLTGTREV